MITFDPNIPLVDIHNACKTIGCRIVSDGKGGGTIVRLEPQPSESELHVFAAKALYNLCFSGTRTPVNRITAARRALRLCGPSDTGPEVA